MGLLDTPYFPGDPPPRQPGVNLLDYGIVDNSSRPNAGLLDYTSNPRFSDFIGQAQPRGILDYINMRAAVALPQQKSAFWQPLHELDAWARRRNSVPACSRPTSRSRDEPMGQTIRLHGPIPDSFVRRAREAVAAPHIHRPGR